MTPFIGDDCPVLQHLQNELNWEILQVPISQLKDDHFQNSQLIPVWFRYIFLGLGPKRPKLIPPCTSRARRGQWPQSVYAGIFRLPINVVQGIAQVFSMQFSRGAKTCLSCHRWCPCVDHVVLKLFQLLIGVVNLLHDTNLGS